MTFIRLMKSAQHSFVLLQRKRREINQSYIFTKQSLEYLLLRVDNEYL